MQRRVLDRLLIGELAGALGLIAGHLVGAIDAGELLQLGEAVLLQVGAAA